MNTYVNDVYTITGCVYNILLKWGVTGIFVRKLPTLNYYLLCLLEANYYNMRSIKIEYWEQVYFVQNRQILYHKVDV